MDFFAGKLNEPIEVKKERHYLEIEYKYRNLAKTCGSILFDWEIKKWFTYEDPDEFKKKFLIAKFEYENNKMKNAIDNVRKTNVDDMMNRYRGQTAIRIIEDKPFKKSDFFSTTI